MNKVDRNTITYSEGARRKLLVEAIQSKAAIRGHPIHPMLIHFPVALLLAAVASDAAWLLTGDFFWARAGLWLTGTGALGGWISGAAGVVDLVLVERIRRLVTPWCHGVLAVLVLSLASLNWLLRFLEAPDTYILPWGAFLSLLTAGMISITSYLGGRLVYEYAIGVDIEAAAGKHGFKHDPVLR